MTNNDIITQPYSQKNMDYAHGEAILEDEARRAEVHTVTAYGLTITRGMLWDEMRRPVHAREIDLKSFGVSRIIGINASSNMFA